MRSIAIATLLLMLAACLLVSTVSAHSRLGTGLKKKYRLRTVSCTACHRKEVKKKKKDQLTPFGTELAKLLKGKMVSERLEAAKEKDVEERKKIEQQIDTEFLEALKRLDKMKAPSGKTYAEAIPAGEIEGTRPRK